MAQTAPYLCDLVPEKAFRRVVGSNTALTANWSNGPQPDNGQCLVRTPGQEPLLGVTWSLNDGEKVIKVQRAQSRAKLERDLPAELGDGVALLFPQSGMTPRPNFSVAMFRCGERKPWISIDFVPVVRGRDAVQDMTDFMRIAQKRFGEIHKCTPRPR
ncbi:hypothetical protein ACQEU3_12165 [Spirillospora sp. CA-253888]